MTGVKLFVRLLSMMMRSVERSTSSHAHLVASFAFRSLSSVAVRPAVRDEGQDLGLVALCTGTAPTMSDLVLLIYCLLHQTYERAALAVMRI